MGDRGDAGQELVAKSMPVTLIERGFIIPIEGPQEVIEDGAVALAGNRIVAVGKTDALRARFPRPHEVIDASGQAVIPGFVNTHVHLVGSLNKGLTEDPPAGASGFFNVAIPLHARHVRDDDIYAVSLAHGLEMLRTGTTCINENWWPQDAAAQCLVDLGLRGVVGPLVREVSFEQMSPTNPNREWDRRWVSAHSMMRSNRSRNGTASPMAVSPAA